MQNDIAYTMSHMRHMLLKKLSMLMDELDAMIAQGSADANDLVYIYDQLSEIYSLILTFSGKR